MLNAPSALTIDTAQCVTCNRSHNLSALSETCTCSAKSNLSVQYPLTPAVSKKLLQSTQLQEQTLWRYAPLLPVDPQFASHLQIGWTPLIKATPVNGVHLYFKDETRNPSGSMKDRASEIVVSVAKANSINHVVMASTGNAAASLACIGAAAKIGVTVLVPHTAPGAKLAQIKAYGARVFRVVGRYDDAIKMALRVTQETGHLNRTTGRNPFTREGKKTAAFEIAEQLGWVAPDWVIVPTGDGNMISAIFKGFKELFTLGIINKIPQLIAAQSEASCVISTAFKDTIGGPNPDAKTTLADSITVDEPLDLDAAQQALVESMGLAVTLSDHEIICAVSEQAANYGIFTEPSSATSFAAFSKLQALGKFQEGESIVCLATGTGLKDLRPVLQNEPP
ncbi:MAG: threonine synthase, partial [Candidatus Azotimanducaceae bacterium]